MSKISGTNTKPEIAIRKALHAKGFRYRKNVSNLPGRPDIVLKKYKTVIFINGCFWHGHNCKKAALPKTNSDFWTNKIQNNISRDSKNTQELELQGWQVIIVWGCEINRKSDLSNVINELSSKIYTGLNNILLNGLDKLIT